MIIKLVDSIASLLLLLSILVVGIFSITLGLFKGVLHLSKKRLKK